VNCFSDPLPATARTVALRPPPSSAAVTPILGLNVNRAISTGLRRHLGNASIWFWDLEIHFCRTVPVQKHYPPTDKSDKQCDRHAENPGAKLPPHESLWRQECDETI
jgi:hypothetical protein